MLGRRGLAALLSDGLLVCVLFGLVEGLLGRRGLAALLFDVAYNMCPFCFDEMRTEKERANCLAF